MNRYTLIIVYAVTFLSSPIIFAQLNPNQCELSEGDMQKMWRGIEAASKLHVIDDSWIKLEEGGSIDSIKKALRENKAGFQPTAHAQPRPRALQITFSDDVDSSSADDGFKMYKIVRYGSSNEYVALEEVPLQIGNLPVVGRAGKTIAVVSDKSPGLVAGEYALVASKIKSRKEEDETVQKEMENDLIKLFRFEDGALSRPESESKFVSIGNDTTEIDVASSLGLSEDYWKAAYSKLNDHMIDGELAGPSSHFMFSSGKDHEDRIKFNSRIDPFQLDEVRVVRVNPSEDRSNFTFQQVKAKISIGPNGRDLYVEPPESGYYTGQYVVLVGEKFRRLRPDGLPGEKIPSLLIKPFSID